MRVPRLTFPAGAGAYRLLLGNPEAEPPRYDLASLRARGAGVLGGAGRAAGRGRANAAYRRGAGDYLKDAPPTLVLWGALLVAVRRPAAG